MECRIRPTSRSNFHRVGWRANHCLIACAYPCNGDGGQYRHCPLNNMADLNGRWMLPKRIVAENSGKNSNAIATNSKVFLSPLTFICAGH
ncbi:hypothetical protein ABID99_003578 [Mucilaginibacter sp. OAE612]|uniref:hypothetical protein n=1 Tax=Mucilaginibacter sp. OAE612 TaxID=3156444 RepID=UPI00359E3949